MLRIQDYALHDPLITEEGVEQCGKLRESLKERLNGIPESDIAIVVSPMRRTIQTALYSLDFLIEKKVPITADAAWQGKHSEKTHLYPIRQCWSDSAESPASPAETPSETAKKLSFVQKPPPSPATSGAPSPNSPKNTP